MRLALALALALSGCAAPTPLAERAVVQVIGAGRGSGVILAPGDRILTAAHVLGDASEVELRLWDGRALPARVRWRAPERDLAALDWVGAAPEDVAGMPRGAGEPADVLARGAGGEARGGPAPALLGGLNLPPELTGLRFGEVAPALPRAWVLDVASAPGDSGGAVRDADGRLIGLIVGGAPRLRLTLAAALPEAFDERPPALALDGYEASLDWLLEGLRRAKPGLGGASFEAALRRAREATAGSEEEQGEALRALWREALRSS